MNDILARLRQDGLQVRSTTGVTLEANEFYGRAIPYGQRVELMRNVYEEFKPGAFAAQTKDPARVKIAYRHGEIIGRAKALEEKTTGLWIRGLIIDDPSIPEAAKGLAALRNDLVDELSIGFTEVKNGTEIKEEGDKVYIIHSRAALREVSLVPWGAYGRSARVTNVRSDDDWLTKWRLEFERLQG